MNKYALFAIVAMEEKRREANEKLAQAKHNFSRLHPCQLDVIYDYDSRKTPNQILAVWQKHVDEANATINWLKKVGDVPA